jgi:L-alanine-DL-glutamate epimerase-like enolase superfamily enzyme
MKVTEVTAVPLAYPDPNDERRTGHLVLVRVATDEGLVGWGETWSRFPEASAAVCAVVRGLADLVVGTDPVATAETHAKLSRHTYWYGEGGIAAMALSAIDIALWDVKGQALDTPLVDLLGGAITPSLPAIAAAHPHGDNPAEMVEHAAATVRGRLSGYKFGMVPEAAAGLGRDHDRDVAFVRDLRAALPAGSLIAVDGRAAVGWDPMTAVRRVRAFEEHGIAWIEEPLAPWDTAGYRTLRDRISTLVGYGEREWTVPGYQRLLADGLVDVVGVDPGRVGGVTGMQRIAERIAAAGKHLNPHCWSGAILSAVGLAVAAASGTALVFEVKPLPTAAQDDLVTEPLRPVDGRVSPPRLPGTGVRVVEDVVDTFREA